MATHLRGNLASDVVADVLDATAAALESGRETGALSADWVLLTSRADALASARRTLDRDGRRARVRLAVRAAEWITLVAAFARALLDASGGKRDQMPYRRFFSKTAPYVIQEYGTKRKAEVARAWLVELERSPNEPLAQRWTSQLSAATEALESAIAERDRLDDALGPHQVSVRLLVEEVNRALDVLEGDLKKLFPCAPERVASFLSATRLRRPASAEAVAQDVESPAG